MKDHADNGQKPRLVLCTCGGTQSFDVAQIEAATGAVCAGPYTALCTGEIEKAAQEMTHDGAVICCTQEWRTFTELAAELMPESQEDAGVDPPRFLDLRDRAGWTRSGENTAPKMAALIADAQVPRPAVKTIDIVSEGTCLIIGEIEQATEIASFLKDDLAVTILVDAPLDAPIDRDLDLICGKVRRIAGSLGQFEVEIDRYQRVLPSFQGPSARGSLHWSPPQDGAQSGCDIVIDLSKGPAFVPAPQKRDGYFKTDPKSRQEWTKTALGARELIGTFEKDLFIRMEPAICAHSRAEQQGCSNCLDICPTSAITPMGDHVAIDPNICAGCGACAMLCPSGAITYDAAPAELGLRRMQAMVRAYEKAGGANPRLLIHDEHGREMIALFARFGTGLPPDVIPMEWEAISSFGHSETLAAHAMGFAEVALILSPQADQAALEREAELASAIWPDAITILDLVDPDDLGTALWDAKTRQSVRTPASPMGTRRQVTRVAAKALLEADACVPLPDHAPYGAVLVDRSACTLCLSCVSLCPSGALGENPDQPQLRFQEDACLQCGLCANICPEDAITYEPRLNLANSALEEQVLNEEEPFACVECARPFGVKSTIERITQKLAGNHAMFANSESLRLIQMCDDCRVNAQYHADNSPFAAAPRPRPRTTDDYLSKRKDH